MRWSPSGELLASGDDESAIIIWKQKTDVDPPALFEADDEQDRETWNVYKVIIIFIVVYRIPKSVFHCYVVVQMKSLDLRFPDLEIL